MTDAVHDHTAAGAAANLALRVLVEVVALAALVALAAADQVVPAALLAAVLVVNTVLLHLCQGEPTP